jgi:hypothetical protein
VLDFSAELFSGISSIAAYFSRTRSAKAKSTIFTFGTCFCKIFGKPRKCFLILRSYRIKIAHSLGKFNFQNKRANVALQSLNRNLTNYSSNSLITEKNRDLKKSGHHNRALLTL